MDPRIGQRIVRDRWGEPIAPLPPDPERPKPKPWLRRIVAWLAARFAGRTGDGK